MALFLKKKKLLQLLQDDLEDKIESASKRRKIASVKSKAFSKRALKRKKMHEERQIEVEEEREFERPESGSYER